jgi:hypothetical protein
MDLFVLVRNDYENSGTVGVYSTEALANAAASEEAVYEVDRHCPASFSVEPFTLDD